MVLALEPLVHLLQAQCLPLLAQLITNAPSLRRLGLSLCTGRNSASMFQGGEE